MIKFVTNQLNAFCGVNAESTALEDVSQMKVSTQGSANMDNVSNSDASSVASFLPKQFRSLSAMFVNTLTTAYI